jgi:hypothetical protein
MSIWAEVAVMFASLMAGAILNFIVLTWWTASFKKSVDKELTWMRALMRQHGWPVPPNGD